MRKPLTAAHTGCGVHPDNTLASFFEAMESGAHIAEVDVHVTLGDTCVLLHDHSPALHKYTYEELNAPEVRESISPDYAEHEIATLEQILRISDARDMLLNLDLKSTDAIDPTAKLIHRFAAQKRVFITGASDTMAAKYPDIKVMYNTPYPWLEGKGERYVEFADSVCRTARIGGYAGLNMESSTCRQEVVDRAHAEGLLVWVYTVNDPQEMKRLIGLGVDAITTRVPGLLLSINEEYKNV
ncbi:glycerophosphodiester phosphodiesterase [Paenibacillus sp. BC26]|uniref:glycerophosphodiester phosphodiesterase n=1 Tax=Paenibacillus sp. BC26 TaxID=1881032 RepID=UPI0008EAA30D|nr:glycerophosphodiester phosphodiesterase [Paenibacillus sp. BC26]SFS53068.1 glycerophosphoryl diester phosphodiesterase [Paenibacillus sp. BC26]